MSMKFDKTMPLTGLFVVARVDAVQFVADGFKSKADAKIIRNELNAGKVEDVGGTWEVSRGPDHWRGLSNHGRD